KVRATPQRRRRDGIPNMKTPTNNAPLLPYHKGELRRPRAACAAVVVIVKVAVPLVVPPPSVIGLPVTEHVICAEAGALQVKLTEPVNPLRASTVMVEVAACPAGVMLGMLAKIEKSGVLGFALLHALNRASASIDPRPVT